MAYFCNPINVRYHYQFNNDPRQSGIQICREAADPSMILFEGKYYIFPSMNLSVWVSEDLAHWEEHRLPDCLPLYDYAPDVRVLGGYVYFCASSHEKNCSRYRTKDILNGPYEEIPGNFPFWDPNMFVDDDGRVYFYWGCSAMTPIYGVELDPKTMLPITEPKGLIWGDPWKNGFERVGEDHCENALNDEELEKAFQGMLAANGASGRTIPENLMIQAKGFLSKRPYIEGAWMDKYNGKYYLQYAFAGTQYNGYGDGVYVSDSPLGEFKQAENNPYSYKPGGFMPGAGHGSTMWDKAGDIWHTASMRISMNHMFERRVGIWPAGFDRDGEMFCNQRYGDWPIFVDEKKTAGGEGTPQEDIWKDPEWFLLSARKKVTASSFAEGHEPEKAAEENCQTWWRAASADPGEWICLDLGKAYDVRAVQVNFADDRIDIPVPGEIRGGLQARYIDDEVHPTAWKLEGSPDGENFFVIEDKWEAETDLTHELIVREEGFSCRYLKLTIRCVPYGQQPCISGLRVFGIGTDEKPEVPEFAAKRTTPMDMEVNITSAKSNTLGYNILWGSSPEKLYHSYMIYKDSQRVGGLVEGREYYESVDAFNESGITAGKVQKLLA